jgi:phosphohistidine phosphatase
MLKLILMRHAKSSLADKKDGDYDRPLSKRGKQAAPAMGRALAKHGIKPDLVLSSPARRTRDTLKLVLEAMEITPPVSYDDRLYSFGDGSSYLNLLSRQKAGELVMIMGHNPSIHNLALRLAETGDTRSLTRMKRKFPTAAAAVIALPFDNWSGLKDTTDANGILELFLTPKSVDG